MAIRFSPIAATCSVAPFTRIKRFVSGRGSFASDAEQRAEGVERIETSIKSEGKLVEVGLQVLRANAVMGADQPGLQVGEHQIQ